MYLPFVVGKRIEYLLAHGRRVEALALAQVAWNQDELKQRFFDNLTAQAEFALQMDKMNRAYGSVKAAVGKELLPIFSRLTDFLQNTPVKQ